MHTKSELLWHLPEQHQTTLLQHARLQNIEKTESSLNTIYFDTPELNLYQQNFQLAIETNADQHYQTLTQQQKQLANFYQYTYHTDTTHQNDPDYTKLYPSKWGNLFAKRQLRQAIQPLFEINRQQIQWILTLNKQSVIVLLEQAQININKTRHNVQLLHLQVNDNDNIQAIEAMYQLALTFQSDLETPLCNTSIVQQGYLSFQQQEVTAQKAKIPSFKTRTTAEDAFVDIMSVCAEQFYNNEKVILIGKDIEGVHQMRVGLRRLRAALSIYSRLIPKPLSQFLTEHIRWLNQYLGPSRDWDVFLTSSLTEIQQHFPDHAGLAELREKSWEKRNQHYKALQDCFSTAPYSHMVLSLQAWIIQKQWRQDLTYVQRQALQQPLKSFAVSVLNKRYKRVCKRGKYFEQLTIDDLHQLRIDIKKLRYAAQFFSSVFAKHPQTKEQLTLLGLIQDNLGELNDVAIARTLLHDVGMEFEHPVRQLLEGWYACSAKDEKQRLEPLWQQFTSDKPFWQY